MLIVFTGHCICAAVQMLTWYRRIKIVNRQHRDTAAFVLKLNTLEGLEQSKEVSES